MDDSAFRKPPPEPPTLVLTPEGVRPMKSLEAHAQLEKAVEPRGGEPVMYKGRRVGTIDVMPDGKVVLHVEDPEAKKLMEEANQANELRVIYEDPSREVKTEVERAREERKNNPAPKKRKRRGF